MFLGYAYHRLNIAVRCTCCSEMIAKGSTVWVKGDDDLCRECFSWMQSEATDRIAASVARMRAGIVARINAKRGCVDPASRF